MLLWGELNVKHAVQRGIGIPIQHLFCDRGNPRKILIEVAGCGTFRMQTDLWPAVRQRIHEP
jgi:hypothetical protein